MVITTCGRGRRTSPVRNEAASGNLRSEEGRPYGPLGPHPPPGGVRKL